MRAEDSGGGGLASPAPRRGLPPKPKSKSTPALPPRWDALSAFRAPAQQQAGPPIPQQQQPWSLVAPARPSVIDVVPQQKPLAVQVVPQQQFEAPSLISSYSDWFSPPSAFDKLNRERDVQGIYAEQLGKAKYGERLRKRGEYEAADQTETAKALTPKQWAALSPLQQAAAQANYDLSLAVKKDFETQGKHKADDTQLKGYQDRVKELFGEEEALGYKDLQYAPNTIAFLDERGIEATNLAGRTLDDFVSGAALVTTEIFDALGEETKSSSEAPGGLVAPRDRNIAFAQDLAKGQLAYQEKLASTLKKGDQLLTDISSAFTNAAANKSYGALESSTHTKLTAVRPETLAQLDKYMQALARTDIPVDQALKTISLDLQELGASSDETAQVWEGLIERSRQGVTGEGKWFEGVDFPMRSPGEVAQALGAPTLKRQATLGAK